MKHPGRLNHLSLAVFDTRLTPERRAIHLRLAFPPGYDTRLAQEGIDHARALVADGRGSQAALVLRALVDDPPTGEAS